MISWRDSEPEVQTLEPVRASFLVSWVKRFKLPIYSISLAYVEHIMFILQKVTKKFLYAKYWYRFIDIEHWTIRISNFENHEHFENQIEANFWFAAETYRKH